MAETLAVQLAAIEKAINSIFDGGQEYVLNGRTFKRADLAELRGMRRHVERRINLATGGRRNLVEFDRL